MSSAVHVRTLKYGCEIMNYLEYLKPELLILVPVLVAVGFALKKVVKQSAWLPFILGGVGIVLSLLYVFGSGNILSGKDLFAALFTGVVQGILCTATAVYTHQCFKQSQNVKAEKSACNQG